jgi:enoyl-CoA hydratase/carnithine racemase
MLPIAGALQRLAERAGRARAPRWAMLGEPISGTVAGQLGIASHVAAESEVAAVAATLARKLATGPTGSYAATLHVVESVVCGGGRRRMQ